MRKWLIGFGLVLIILAFYFMLLSLMNLFPIVVAAPLLYLAIVYTLHVSSNHKRFKGFRSQ